MLTEKIQCRICGSLELERFLDLHNQPLANAFLHQKNIVNEEFYPLTLARCTNLNCGLVQLAHVVDRETLFANYLYVSSTSPLFVRHFEEYARRIVSRLDLAGALTLDIGSNDGVLVRALQTHGAKALGIDPAIKIAEEATNLGRETITGYFSESFAKKLRRQRGPAKLISANNVFAHIDDLDEVMRGVEALLSKEGLFVIEVPYLVDFLEKKLFDTIYHEHLSYLAVCPLVLLFKRHQMYICDVEKVAVHGGSLRIMVAHEGAPFKKMPIVEILIRDEKTRTLQHPSVYQQFRQSVLASKHALILLLKGLKKDGQKIAAYGAPAKGNTLLNFMKIGPKILDYIVDDNPLKQGLVSPGMHIPVVPAAHLTRHPPDYLFILAWNFSEAIIEKNKEFRGAGGKFIIPVPTPQIL